MQRTELFEALRRRALYWLAQRDQSEAELTRKLWGVARSLSNPAPKPRSVMRRRLATADESAQADSPDNHWVESEALISHHDPDGAPAAEVAELIEQLLSDLREQGFLSDQRFIDTRIRGRQSRFGMIRIQREIAEHGLLLDEAQRQQLADSELSRAHAVWARKFSQPALDPAERAAQTRFLLQRGFSHDVVRRVLRGEGAPEDS